MSDLYKSESLFSEILFLSNYNLYRFKEYFFN